MQELYDRKSAAVNVKSRIETIKSLINQFSKQANNNLEEACMVGSLDKLLASIWNEDLIPMIHMLDEYIQDAVDTSNAIWQEQLKKKLHTR